MGKIILMTDAFFFSTPFRAHSSGKISCNNPLLSSNSKADGGFWRKYDLVQFIHNPFFGYNGDAFLIALNRIKCIGMNKNPSCEAKRTARIIRNGSVTERYIRIEWRTDNQIVHIIQSSKRIDQLPITFFIQT